MIEKWIDLKGKKDRLMDRFLSKDFKWFLARVSSNLKILLWGKG
ncbi:hypothetical protein [Clostridium sp.]